MNFFVTAGTESYHIAKNIAASLVPFYEAMHMRTKAIITAQLAWLRTDPEASVSIYSRNLLCLAPNRSVMSAAHAFCDVGALASLNRTALNYLCCTVFNPTPPTTQGFRASSETSSTILTKTRRCATSLAILTARIFGKNWGSAINAAVCRLLLSMSLLVVKSAESFSYLEFNAGLYRTRQVSKKVRLLWHFSSFQLLL